MYKYKININKGHNKTTIEIIEVHFLKKMLTENTYNIEK